MTMKNALDNDTAKTLVTALDNLFLPQLDDVGMEIVNALGDTNPLSLRLLNAMDDVNNIMGLLVKALDNVV